MNPIDLVVNFDVARQPLAIVLLAITLSAVVQDDLTCLVAGMSISTGQLSVVPTLVACFAGTLLGDLLWFYSGRILGNACLQRAPVRWVVKPNHLTSAREFFEQHGPQAVFLTRFMPGIRTPVHVAAGLFTVQSGRCLTYFVAAVALYVPLMVGVSAWFGTAVNVRALYEHYGYFALLAIAVALWLTIAGSRYAWRRVHS